MKRLLQVLPFLFVLACFHYPHSAVRSQVRLTIDMLDVSRFPDIRAKVKVEQNGLPVGNLTIGNFAIREDSLNQHPIYGGCQDSLVNQKVSVALVLDRSGSIQPDWNTVQISAKTFIDKLAADDSLCVLSFGGKDMFSNVFVVNVEMGWTDDKTILKESIDHIEDPAGGTPLWHAVVAAANEFPGQSGRKAMIVVTDGMNTAINGYTLTQAITAAKNLGVNVYTIALGFDIDEDGLKQLARQTGGNYYAAPTSSALDAIYQDITREIKPTGLCEVGYISRLDCLDGSEHTVEIVVNTGFGLASASAQFTLPFDSSTFSFIDIAVDDSSIVDAGKTITVPVRIINITDNRPPAYFSFHVGFDKTLLHLIEVRTTPLSTNYQIGIDDTPNGVRLTMQGATPITQKGDLVYLVFKAENVLQRTQSLIDVSQPEVRQACTHATCSGGAMTVCGICDLIIIRKTTPTLKTALLPNTPNPFNPTTTVHYSVGMETPVVITLHDPIGRELQTLVNQKMYPGQYSVTLNGSNLQNGVYFLKLVTLGSTDTRRIVLLK